MANLLENGQYVLCPLAPDKVVKKSVRLKPSKDNLPVPRSQCLSEAHLHCPKCVNYTFDGVFKVIGDENEFRWLEKLISQIALALGCEVKRLGREFGDCCLDHPDCILNRYEYVFEDAIVAAEDSMRDAYKVIKAAAEEKGYELVHMKVNRRPGAIRFKVAIRLL